MNREQLANRVIQDHVTYAVAAGAMPVPLVDLAAVTAVQLDAVRALARVESESSSWLGFVPVSFLRDPIREGSTFIAAVVVQIRGECFTARLPEGAVTAGDFNGSVARETPIRALQA